MDNLKRGNFYIGDVIKGWKKCALFFFPAMAASFTLIAQKPALGANLDKNEILIGQPFHVKFTASFPSALYKANWYNIPDSLEHFEVLAKSKIDTLEQNGNTQLQQTISFTSFDSGLWKLPGFTVNFQPVGDAANEFLITDSIPIKVSFQPDTTTVLRDIKPVRDVVVRDYFWYYVAGGILLLILLTILAIVLYKKRKKKPKDIFSGKLGAYDEAMAELDQLKSLDLNVPADAKEYHIRLSAIFRRYSSRKLQLNLMNKTTGDVLMELPAAQIRQEELADVAAALRIGDAVKFAKYLPPAYESEGALEKIKNTIKLMERTPAAQTNSN